MKVVEGTPLLRLNAAASAFATYVSGGSAGVLSFLYAVSEGDETSDLDLAGATALVVPAGAAIKVSESPSPEFVVPHNRGPCVH